MKRRKFLQTMVSSGVLAVLPFGLFRNTDRLIGKSPALGMPYERHYIGTHTGRFAACTRHNVMPYGSKAVTFDRGGPYNIFNLNYVKDTRRS